MSWVKDREEFKQAALSTARALSKNSTLESTTQASSRPPSSSQISLNYPPRSSKQVNSWRGEADFQTFWHTFHNDDASLKMPKIARDFFLELELSRVEIDSSISLMDYSLWNEKCNVFHWEWSFIFEKILLILKLQEFESRLGFKLPKLYCP